jgi:CMP-N,N'-diacetyllegionaminic acid synthase
MILVYVPARGGSKGIPYKNIKPILGKPLLNYTLDIVRELEQQYPNEIYPFFSTDDEEISNVAAQNGFSTEYRRPEYLSGDTSTIVDGVLDALDWLKKEKNIHPQKILLLQPTSPLRTLEQVKLLLEIFNRKHAKSMFSVIPMRQHPYECICIDKEEWNYLASPTKEAQQRQSYQNTFYFIDGSYYLVTIDFFLTHRTFIDKGHSIPFIIEDKFLIDIDEPEDMVIAESILRLRMEQ